MSIPGKKMIEVVTYCGYTSNERPLRFLLGKKNIEVKDISNRWRDQESDFFKIIGNDGSGYLLKRQRSTDKWFLVKKGLAGQL